MRTVRTTAVILSISLLVWVARPRSAYALDLASSTVATIGGVVAIVGAILMGQEENKDTGRTMLIAGLAVSAASSAAAIVLNLVVLASADRVLQLEREAQAGGGPLIDALSTAFGVTRQEVIASIHRVERHSTGRGAAMDPQAFCERLLADLASRATLSDAAATQILYDLHLERSNLSGSRNSRHGVLAEIVGVPPEVIAPIVAEHLDRALHSGQVPGKIVSARTILAANARSILDGLIDDIATRHATDLQARAAEARSKSRVYRELSYAN